MEVEKIQYFEMNKIQSSILATEKEVISLRVPNQRQHR
jgi:hypothetical protein